MNLNADERLQAEARNTNHLFKAPPGAYRPSGPALHTVRTLVKNFVIEPLPEGRYEASMLNLCKLVDVFTQAHKLEKALGNLARQVRWVHKHELERDMEAFQEALRAVEIVHQALPQYNPGEQAEVSAPAYAATQVLMRHFNFIERPNGGRILPTFRNIAICIDVCSRIRVAQQAIDRALLLPWARKDDLRHCLDDLRKTVRALEANKNAMPHLERPITPLWRKQSRVGEPELTRKQRQQLTETGRLLAQARTPLQEKSILTEMLR